MSGIYRSITAQTRAAASIATPTAPPNRVLQRTNTLPALLALIGIILPSEIQLSIAGANFTAGRISIVLLVVPALAFLAKAGRHAVLSDLVAIAIAIWMIGAAAYAGGFASAFSAAAEAVDFVGGYIVARAFFFEPSALGSFIRILRVLTIIAILAATADSISGKWIVHNTVASIVNVPPFEGIYRGNLVRAASTFDHPILFGTFCSLVMAILLYSEPRALRGLLWAGFCFFGCLLSQSSAAALSFFIVALTYIYDRSTTKYPARWIFLWTVVAAFFSAVFLISDHPIGWVISHLTLDPETGYYRILIWDAAFDQISQFPVTGSGFNLFHDYFLDHTIDCVWLVVGLRYGIPMIALLVALNFSAILPAGRSSKSQTRDDNTDRMHTAFTLVILTFMFVGLTVHFWNYIWIFWGLCIGIRASLREQSLIASH